ncbi:hypothetical protein E8E11_000032 [Didymella keratinophila]|nr:hypothetical protein E8E11_000032 [Didymella keratinophila]
MSPTWTNRTRMEFGKSTCAASSYPSPGGIIMKHFTSVELDYLGLSRMEPSGCEEGFAKEDAFALRMLQLGARWWPSRKFHKKHSDEQYPYGYHYPPDTHVGYPSTGGVVILKLWAGNSGMRLDGDPPEKPENWAKVTLCQTMDERCSALKSFGALSYSNLEGCPDIPKTLEAGVAEGKKYEQLMLKMEDSVYLDEWLNSL